MKKLLFFTGFFVVAVFVKTFAQSSCPAITGLTVSNITNTNATFDWNAGSFTGYNIEYKPSYTTTWIWFGGGSVPHQEMSVFSPGTTYDLRVGGTSLYGDCPPSAFITFTTTGSVPPPVPYCTAKGSSTTYGWIKSVSIGTINNVSGNNNGYANFTRLSANVTGNAVIPLTVQAGAKKTPQSQLWAVYADLNNDGDFLDAGETVANFVSVGGEIVIQNIIIPTTLTGPRRMRIKMQYMFNASGGSCGSFPSGEVEDYTINITSAVAARIMDNAPSNVSAKVAAGSQLKLAIYPNPARDNLNVVYP
ncbi:MAG: GEVED domain-containing protein, partial [Chitinophagaceae bacterium]